MLYRWFLVPFSISFGRPNVCAIHMQYACRSAFAVDLFDDVCLSRFSIGDLSTFAFRYVDAALGPRPCRLRAARLNPPPPEGSERVWIRFRNSLRIL